MTPAGTSNELDVQNEWEETHTHTYLYIPIYLLIGLFCRERTFDVIELGRRKSNINRFLLRPKKLPGTKSVGLAAFSADGVEPENTIKYYGDRG